MSASIKWRLHDANNKSLSVAMPSHFQECMRRAGFELPCTIKAGDLAILQGLAASVGDKDDNPYQRIIAIVLDHGPVDIWAEY